MYRDVISMGPFEGIVKGYVGYAGFRKDIKSPGLESWRIK